MRKVLVAIAGMALLLSACGSASSPKASPPPTTATTSVASTTTTTAVPAGSFLVASFTVSPLQYSTSPGGPPAGTLPTVTWGTTTVRPVVAQTDGWVEIGLDTRPNYSTGWVPRAAVNLALTGFRIEVSVSKRSLTLYQNGQSVYTSPVGVGEPQWPTPVGRTFVDAVVATPKFQVYIYGPTVVILGVHSDTFLNFDGGDGTVAIHGYPSNPKSAEGEASSHGCVRANPETIKAIDIVPLGSPVDIVA